MQRFILKMYVRENPTVSVGKLWAEWFIDVETDREAAEQAETLLKDAGFEQPKDFASLRDEAGTSIREWVRHA